MPSRPSLWRQCWRWRVATKNPENFRPLYGRFSLPLTLVFCTLAFMAFFPIYLPVLVAMEVLAYTRVLARMGLATAIAPLLTYLDM